MQDGIEVKSGATQRRLVGGMYAIERQSGFQAPIDVHDWRGVDNLHNRQPRKIAKYCPYAGDTQETIPGNTQWRPWQNDTSFRINFYCVRPTNLRALASIQVVSADVAVQVDAISGLHPYSAIGVTANFSHFHQVKSLETQILAGVHYVIPMAQAARSSRPQDTSCTTRTLLLAVGVRTIPVVLRFMENCHDGEHRRERKAVILTVREP